MDIDLSDDLDTSISYYVDLNPISRGAEATILTCKFLGKPAILKQRISKVYRHPELDKQLIKQRLTSEVRGIAKCKMLGVPVPAIYFVNEYRSEIVFEEIEGCNLREYLLIQERTLSSDEYQLSFCEIALHLGKLIAKMHIGGLIHGDLTSANVLLRNGQPDQLCLIDFGLSYQKEVSEDKAVDLYVFERALAALHDGLEKTTFEAIRKGYESINAEHAAIVYKRLEEVRLRGRKRDMIG
uniref:Non-specific serine/threonine protein kinase n=1 Tax=Panagrolaimus sp. ES5 TaxID=591445 RepID=A0AC34FCJ9_9BILA